MVRSGTPFGGQPESVETVLPSTPPAAHYRVAMVSPVGDTPDELWEMAEREGLDLEAVKQGDASRLAASGDLHAVLLDLTEADRPAAEGAGRDMELGGVPVVALLSREHLAAPDLQVECDDFVVYPWRPGELTIRIRRLVERRQHVPADAPGVIRVGDLVIDTNRYDVFVANRPVLLTFKEYELLKLLASNPGRVFSREALLEQVWGYEYFGGTRTVDVHIRRLRSKADDATHTFIDTVWNVGYRFRA